LLEGFTGGCSDQDLALMLFIVRSSDHLVEIISSIYDSWELYPALEQVIAKPHMTVCERSLATY